MGTRQWDDSEGPSLFSSSGGFRQTEQFFGVLPWEICLHAPLFPQEKGLLCWEGHPAQGSQPGGAGEVAWSSAQPAVWGAQLELREQKAVLRWCSRFSGGWVCFQGQTPRFRRLIMKYSLNVAGKTVASQGWGDSLRCQSKFSASPGAYSGCSGQQQCGKL